MSAPIQQHVDGLRAQVTRSVGVGKPRRRIRPRPKLRACQVVIYDVVLSHHQGGRHQASPHPARENEL